MIGVADYRDVGETHPNTFRAVYNPQTRTSCTETEELELLYSAWRPKQERVRRPSIRRWWLCQPPYFSGRNRKPAPACFIRMRISITSCTTTRIECRLGATLKEA